MTRQQLTARIVAFACATALIMQLAGLRHWVLPTSLVLLLLAAAHLAEPIRRGWTSGDARRFAQAHAFEIGVAVLALMAIAVRLPGLNGELGHTPIDFDENRLGASIKTFFTKGELQHTTVEHYPGLAFWLFAGSSFISMLYRIVHGAVAPPALLPIELFVGASRVANLFVAAGTVAFTTLIAARITSRGAALLAGLIVAIVPLSVETTTLCRCDPVMVLGVVIAVYLALRAQRESQRRWFAAAGAVAGAAAAVKYSGVFAIVPALLAVLAVDSWRERARAAGLILVCFVAAVAITNHFIWSDVPNFMRQLTDQVAITGPGHWAATENPRGFYVMILDRFGPGIGPLVAAALFAIYTLSTRRLDLWIVISFPILYMWAMTGRPSQFPRWVYPMVPFVAIASAAAIAAAIRFTWERPPTLSHGANAARAGVAALLVVGLLAEPLWSGTVALSRRLTQPTYARAEAWMREHATAGQVVLLEKGWLDLSSSGLVLRRVDDLRRTFDVGMDALSGCDWVVVPETQFGHPLIKQLGFYQRVHADQRFGGSLGYDYEIYAVPQR